MEKIKINDMQTKGVVFIVKYQHAINAVGDVQEVSQEATMNTNFNKQEIWYLEKEVGIGGTVDVEITIKEKVGGNPSAGFWTNITKVDMKSAVKGQNLDRIYEAKQGDRSTDGQEQKPVKEKYRTPEEMVACEILKGAVELVAKIDIMDTTQEQVGKYLCDAVRELTGAYKVALSGVKGL